MSYLTELRYDRGARFGLEFQERDETIPGAFPRCGGSRVFAPERAFGELEQRERGGQVMRELWAQLRSEAAYDVELSFPTGWPWNWVNRGTQPLAQKQSLTK